MKVLSSAPKRYVALDLRSDAPGVLTLARRVEDSRVSSVNEDARTIEEVARTLYGALPGWIPAPTVHEARLVMSGGPWLAVDVEWRAGTHVERLTARSVARLLEDKAHVVDGMCTPL